MYRYIQKTSCDQDFNLCSNGYNFSDKCRQTIKFKRLYHELGFQSRRLNERSDLFEW